jgi:hypothetical protein
MLWVGKVGLMRCSSDGLWFYFAWLVGFCALGVGTYAQMLGLDGSAAVLRVGLWPTTPH